MLTDKNFDNLYSVRSFVRKTQKRALISGLILGSLFAILWSGSVGFGFLSGVAVSIVNFQLMSVDAYTTVGKEPKKVRKFITGRSILRYAIMFGFLAFVASRTDFNIFAAFFGIFFVKAVLVGGEILQVLNLAGKTSRGLYR